MPKYVVLWTSHKQATIVSVTDGVEKILHIESGANGRAGEKRECRLNEYYRKVIRAIQDAEEIFIFAPAQTKLDLKSEILKIGTLSHRVVGTETADTMTENQLVTWARVICRSQIV